MKLVKLGWIGIALLGSLLVSGASETYARSGGVDNIAVSAHCPITGATGTGRASTFETARAKAIRACVGKGGIPACCAKYISRM